jgi:hypothetical protein
MPLRSMYDKDHGIQWTEQFPTSKSGVHTKTIIIRPGLDTHLFELGPHHYHRGKGGLVKIKPQYICEIHLKLVPLD